MSNSILHKWEWSDYHQKKFYSIRDYTTGICVENYTNAYKAKLAFKDAVKEQRKCYQRMRELAIGRRL